MRRLAIVPLLLPVPGIAHPPVCRQFMIPDRKAGFIREFEKVVTGGLAEPGPSFLEKARARWAPPE